MSVAAVRSNRAWRMTGHVRRSQVCCEMAEREGFEPSVPVRAQRFSRPPRSTTPAPLRMQMAGPRATGPVDEPRALADASRLAKLVPDARHVGFACCRARTGTTYGGMTQPRNQHRTGRRRHGAAGRPCPLLDRRRGPAPPVRFPRRDLRHRPGLRQQRGMVSGDPRGHPAAQGPAFLPSARRECGIELHRLCQPAESAARRRAASRSTIRPSPACSRAFADGRYRLRPERRH